MAFDVNSLQRARALMSPEWESRMREYKGQGVSSINYDAPAETYLTEGQLYESGYDMSNIRGVQQGPRNISESGLPDVIKKSFMETEINVDCLNPDYKNAKTFEDAMNAVIAENEAASRNNRQVINETIYPQPSNMGIDRNFFMSIIDECLDKKLKTLNESVIKGVRLKEGKIMLTDHAGNVFSATLEYKGNVNEQKNKKRG